MLIDSKTGEDTVKFVIDSKVAKDYGTDQAVILGLIVEDTLKRSGEIEVIGGMLYRKYAMEDFIRKIPWLTYSRVLNVIRSLVKAGVLDKKYLSSDTHHRVGWYAVTDDEVVRAYSSAIAEEGMVRGKKIGATSRT